jgi:2-polyprenyl-3-methyl-5-hydroxy-6-metoxy-1,4-benzoquinol methylase
MDGPGLDPARHARALRGLARLNFLSRSASTLWHPLEGFGRELGTRRLRVLDVATGAGDVPVRLWERARRAGLDWQLAGCDVSPVAVAHARARAESAGAEVSFFVADALEGPPWADYDAVVCSLFLHHLDEEQACTLLRRMAGLPTPARPRLVLVNDLVRSLAGLALAFLASRLLTASRVVHADAPRSVEGAFTAGEVRALAEKAGLHGAAVERRWPCRYLLTWRRT